MSKHTYRPDAKSVAERIMRRMGDRPTGVDAPFGIEGRTGEVGWAGEPDQTILGVADLAAVVGGAVQSYRLRFDPVDDRSDLCRPFFVAGDRVLPVNVFVRRRGAAGQA